MTPINCFKKFFVFVTFRKETDSTLNNLRIVLWVLLLHFILSFFGNYVYLGVLYGPLFLYAFFKITDREISKSTLFLQVFPLVVFVAILYATKIIEELNLLLFINVILMYVYGGFFLVIGNKTLQLDNRNWWMFCGIFMGVFALISGTMITRLNLGLPFDLNPNTAMQIQLVSSILLVSKALVFDKSPKLNSSETEIDDRDDREANVLLIEKIEDYFEDTNHFLDPNFDFQRFSEDIQIPKSLLSAVINKEMHKNFYMLLAQHRINHAKDLLIKQEHLFKIESVIYESGFSSKSSFHKYFKQFEGTTPSTFRDNYLSEKKKSELGLYK